jgi:hypothetical protein
LPLLWPRRLLFESQMYSAEKATCCGQRGGKGERGQASGEDGRPPRLIVSLLDHEVGGVRYLARRQDPNTFYLRSHRGTHPIAIAAGRGRTTRCYSRCPSSPCAPHPTTPRPPVTSRAALPAGGVGSTHDLAFAAVEQFRQRVAVVFAVPEPPNTSRARSVSVMCTGS